MENKHEIERNASLYQRLFLQEDHEALITFLQANEEVFNRRNFNGHITASAFIVDENKEEMLLLRHKLYDRFLQPGGHVEKEDASIMQAALREASEETGIPKDELTYLPIDAFNIPLDIDSHYIPANPRKNELEHIHHDFRYLFVYSGSKNISIPPSEAKEAKWVPLHDLKIEGIFSRVAQKIAEMF